MSSSEIRSLEPRPLWNCFADLNAVPRPSKREERVVAFVVAFAQQHGLQHQIDSAGNVIIRKPASADRMDRPAVIMQAHLDMVHKAADGAIFDFDKQGIEMWVDGDWVRARGTTLGADNGLGVAAILAVLASKDLSHPPIEALLTLDEEQGMGGALGLQPGLLTGKTMLNLDSEEDDTFTIGCAGGIDTVGTFEYTEVAHDSATPVAAIEITGLRGGHSGLQIHEGRANAIKLMTRLLHACGEKVVALSTMRGGSARNAIPAQCTAIVVILDQARFDDCFQREAEGIREEFRLIEPGLSIASTPVQVDDGGIGIMGAEHQKSLVLAMQAVVNGVYRMSPVVPGLVEASSNFSTIALGGGKAEWGSLQRSSVESSKLDVARTFRAPFELIGAHLKSGDPYPGWSPSAESPILDKMKKIYRELFGHEVKVGACHAGLECGVISIAYPGLDMISFGPNIHEAHSEKECASISSTQKFWKLLTKTLADL
ncbi:aminoacyl-histidine dipeptidase [Prosthecobacter vanneervenii]|uniref:Cytosol non-specific dipeptidase n=1 Tax=Prosthecobacter vanneervenii TaxID=48466 RepID=A0A7W8DL73_9BACT|nr:aminoacyl-histidine dipeptidase [Prosthecobacter vanneervenii]MBB5034008.1 dipeptidase D [Prosthecobacter vanneervenii]